MSHRSMKAHRLGEIRHLQLNARTQPSPISDLRMLFTRLYAHFARSDVKPEMNLLAPSTLVHDNSFFVNHGVIYQHHTENFVDPTTESHTQTIGSF